MSKKAKIIILMVLTILLSVILIRLINLWNKDFIPTQIAKIYTSIYFGIKYPEVKMKYEGMEYGPQFRRLYNIFLRQKWK